MADILQSPLIQNWKVAAQQLTGEIFGHPTYADGTVLKTSDVVFVAVVGAKRQPIAYTRSGSIYRLGEPDPDFGEASAQAFVLANAKVGIHQHKSEETVPEVPVNLRD
jgi:hypothetical protein